MFSLETCPATRTATTLRASSPVGYPLPDNSDFKVGVDFENHTSHPGAGQLLLYPGGFSETEILLPYGGCRFSSIVGQLAGNHFLTVVEGNENLRPLGELALWHGAQEIVFDLE